MRNRFIITLAAALAASLNVFAQSDGPYIFYREDGKARVVTVGKDGQVNDSVVDKVGVGSTFTVTSHSGEYSFDVTLHENVRPEWKQSPAEKTLIMSDPHGNLECVISLLQGNGVIDSSLKWSFGQNRLVIIGDIFDRGNDVTQIFWLVYKLEQEAQKAGGNVTFLYGNHEPMVLAGDLRYAKEKYTSLAEKIGSTYQDMMGKDTELGHWLATRNTIQVIGDALYVHAGLSQDFLDKNLSIPEVNEIISNNIFKTSAERKATSELTYFLFKTYGPIWYRGLVYSKKKYVPASMETLDAALTKYGVSRIFVGHTIFKNVKTFYRKKVVDVNVDNKVNMAKGRSRGILLQNGKTYVVGDKGIIKSI
ncbi:MAG: metallophosphoesterase [Bacteroidales bacterium]|nr:metallophosphoesterase [Bacteroidales bacterium]